MKMKEKDLSCFGWIFTACLVLGRLLATERHYYYKTTCCSVLRSDPSASSSSSDEGNSLLFFLLVFVGDGFFLSSWHRQKGDTSLITDHDGYQCEANKSTQTKHWPERWAILSPQGHQNPFLTRLLYFLTCQYKVTNIPFQMWLLHFSTCQQQHPLPHPLPSAALALALHIWQQLWRHISCSEWAISFTPHSKAGRLSVMYLNQSSPLCLTLNQSSPLCLTLNQSSPLCLTVNQSSPLCLTLNQSSPLCLTLNQSSPLCLTSVSYTHLRAHETA